MTNYRLIFWVFGLLPGLISLTHADSRVMTHFGQRAEGVEEKRVKKTLWSRPDASSFEGKSFPIEKWNKHFSSLGSKRAPMSVGETKKKERFKVEMLDRKTVEFDMSRWNERMADLHERAGIQMDARAQLVADRQIYNMMLQDTKSYRELAEELSLRDLNRFQFRRNRSNDGVPVQQAGSGK